MKFHVGERHADGSLRTLVDRADITRLGEGQGDSGVLADGGDRPHRRGHRGDGRRGAPDRCRSRSSRSARPVCAAPRTDRSSSTRCDPRAVTVEVISGEEEARLAYLAATSALPSARGRLVVFDSGGGSTQFTFGRDDHVEEQFSVDVGAVRIAERFGLDVGGLDRHARRGARRARRPTSTASTADPGRTRIVAIGGTATNLAAVKHGLARYDPDVVHGTVLDVAEVDRQIELYRTAAQTNDVGSSACSRPAPRSSSAARASCARSSPSSSTRR